MKSRRFLTFLFFAILLASLAFAISCGGDDDDDDDDNDDDNDDDDDDNDDDNDDDTGDDDDDDNDTGDDDDDTGDNEYDAVKDAGEIGFIDFEDGSDGVIVASTIAGLEFTNTEGYDWIYGDWRTGNYNGPYPNGGQYYSNGNFFAWLGEQQGVGIITFVSAYATYFQVSYCSNSPLHLEAYDIEGDLLIEDVGEANLGTGEMSVLRVEMPGMAYVMVHDTENQWLIDDLETDARPY